CVRKLRQEGATAWPGWIGLRAQPRLNFGARHFILGFCGRRALESQEDFSEQPPRKEFVPTPALPVLGNAQDCADRWPPAED
ncbi:unnamed protein product, partial [Amoebophrya sp. A120]